MTDQTTADGDDNVYYDAGGPGEEDGFPWVFAPADSAFAERFSTREKAQEYALAWISARSK